LRYINYGTVRTLHIGISPCYLLTIQNTDAVLTPFEKITIIIIIIIIIITILVIPDFNQAKPCFGETGFDGLRWQASQLFCFGYHEVAKSCRDFSLPL